MGAGQQHQTRPLGSLPKSRTRATAISKLQAKPGGGDVEGEPRTAALPCAGGGGCFPPGQVPPNLSTSGPLPLHQGLPGEGDALADFPCACKTGCTFVMG